MTDKDATSATIVTTSKHATVDDEDDGSDEPFIPDHYVRAGIASCIHYPSEESTVENPEPLCRSLIDRGHPINWRGSDSAAWPLSSVKPRLCTWCRKARDSEAGGGASE